MSLPSYYRWDNTGAPVAKGEEVSLVEILEACLVEGYGQQSVTGMAHAAGLVTVTTAAAHNLNNFSRQTIAGANESGYNGTFIITVTGSDTFTYTTTGITDASATGTMTTKTAGAGWTMPYINVDGDVAAFRNDSVGGTGFFLQVDGAGGTNVYTPKVQGFEAMTSETAGTNPFHATAQIFAVSTTANTTARPWALLADDRAVYLWVWAGITANPIDTNYTASELFFGDIESWYGTDAYAAALCSGGPAGGFGWYQSSATLTGIHNLGGICIPRTSGGVVSTSFVSVLHHGGGPGNGGLAYIGAQGASWSSGDTIVLSRPYLNEGAAHSYRGHMPGFFGPCHTLAFGQLAEVSVDGKTYLSVNVHGRNNASSTNRSNKFFCLDEWW